VPSYVHAISAVVIGAMFALPAIGTGQTTRTQSGAPNAADIKTPQQHLDEAKRIVAGVNEASLSGEAAKRFAVLKRDLNELAAAYLKRTELGSAPGSAHGADRPTGTSGTSIPGSVAEVKSKDWRTSYTAVEAAVTDLVGSGSNSPSGSSTATTAPPSGGVPNLDAAVRGQLQEVRTHLAMFYAGTMGEADAQAPAKK
jgi:hypothetical protein